MGNFVPRALRYRPLWCLVSFWCWPSRDEENFCATVPKDGRSYSPTLFAQTVRVLKKINKPGNMIVAFSNLAERIKVRRIICLLTCSIKIMLSTQLFCSFTRLYGGKRVLYWENVNKWMNPPGQSISKTTIFFNSNILFNMRVRTEK